MDPDEEDERDGETSEEVQRRHSGQASYVNASQLLATTSSS